MAAELALTGSDDDGEDAGLSERQVNALEKLFELGGQPRQTATEKYDSDPQRRALQMVFEGKLGGARNRAQATLTREKRVSVTMTEFIRTKLAPKLKTALERALDDESSRINLDAVRLAVDIEHKEAKLQLTEDQADVDSMTKGELVATIIALAQDAETGQTLEAVFEATPTPKTDEAIAEAAKRAADRSKKSRAKSRSKSRRSGTGVRSAKSDSRAVKQGKSAPVAGSGKRNGDSPHAVEDRPDARSAGEDGRRAASGDHKKNPNPFTEAALRRAADRRRAS